MPPDQDPERSIRAPDLFHDPAVRRGRKAVSAVFLRDRDAERSQVREPSNDFRRDAFLPVDARGVDPVARERLERAEKRGDGLPLLGGGLRERKQKVLANRARKKRFDRRRDRIRRGLCAQEAASLPEPAQTAA
jgi:hypothetical protein